MDIIRKFGIGALLLTIIGLYVYLKHLETTKAILQNGHALTLPSVPTVTYTMSSQMSIVTTDSLVTENLTQSNDSTAVHSEFVTPTIPERFSSKRKRLESGCVVAYYYNDQQIGSLPNLLSFQCWAVTVNMSVVEPVMIRSKFGAPLNSEQVTDNIGFSQMFNIDHLIETLPDPPLAPLISWSDFIDNGPRDVILVNFGEGWTQRHSIIHECSAAQEYSEFLKRHNFRVVREVCVEHLAPMPSQKFNSFVLGNYTSNVSVIFSEWGGIDGMHVKITGSKCHRTRFKSMIDEGQVNSSRKPIEDANTYINKHFHGAKFISVMVRSEYLVRSTLVDVIEQLKEPRALPTCLETIQHAWEKLKQSTEINATLLSFDWGRFGSMFYNTYRKDLYDFIKNHTDRFFNFVYGSSTTIEEWEQSFIDVSGTSNPGYIAMLQKSIAVRAKCILLAGGGNFQNHALTLYKHLHPKNQCYMYFGKTCSLEDSST